MAGEVALSDLADLVASTLQKVEPNKYWNELIGQSYIAETFMKNLKPKSMGGRYLSYQTLIKGDEDGDDSAGEPGAYGAYEVLGSTADEGLVTGQIPWCTYHTYWTLSSQEIRFNRADTKAGFIDITKQKFEMCVTKLKNIIERHFWATTGYSHESSAAPWILGPNYWITDDGYHYNDSGGSNNTVVGNIDPTNSDYNDPSSINRWRNQYNEISSLNELPDALDEMFVDAKFVAPPNLTMAIKPTYAKYKIVMDKTSYKGYKKLQKRLRDNVGSDLSSGDMIFNNLTLEYTDRKPARADSTYETFFFNLGTWDAYVDTQNNFRKDPVIKPPNQDARLQRMYFWPALVCRSRRNNGKIFGYVDLIEE